MIEFSGGAGTFFDVKDYFYFSLPFIPFAITGLVHYWKKNKLLLIALVITALMVLFGLFFHNRFIIYLDIFIIIYAALGFYVLIQNRRIYGKLIVYGFIGLFLVLIFIHSLNSKPLISEEEFFEIKKINHLVEDHALVMVTHSAYSPWFKGWVHRSIIAPGMFDENLMGEVEWIEFWQDVNRGKYIGLYEKPLYIYVGEKQPQYEFNETCFKLLNEKEKRFYNFIC